MYRLVMLLLVCGGLSACSGGSSSRSAAPAQPPAAAPQPPPPVGNAPNTKPTIGLVADLTIDANSRQSTRVIVGDDQTAAADLTVTASTNDNRLLASIQVGANGANREIDVVPSIDETGSAQVELTVSDAEGLSASTQFGVNVVAVQRSGVEFARALATADALDAPQLLNAFEFSTDAEDHDFSDLLQ